MTHILASLQSLTYNQEKNPGLPGLKNRYVFMFEGRVQDSRFKIQVGCKKPGNSGFSGLEGQIDLVGAIVEENSYLRNLTLGFVSIFHKCLHRVATTPLLTLDRSP